MGCAIQWVSRKGNGGVIYGGYVVNDGTHIVFVDTRSKGNTRPLYLYLGKGDDLKGMAVYRESAFIMPDVLLNAAQYNTLVASMDDSKIRSFKGG
ncbi:hypothetical protein SEA_EMMA1919_268 [Streptomyces phage Emma1919]|nr:hypothetical protein SEA_EMMA1919_1 [Streptomyces phage Emma1919]URQ04849.1 hypothetical protein SEA_EMMA1919_268 [Streptomyces phage Emma1919]